MKLPQDFIEKYQTLLGSQASDFFASFSLPSEKGFRINPLKDRPRDIAYSLANPVLYTKTGYYGTVSGRSLEHQTGYVYSQDLSAMYVAENISVRPEDKVLDLCAAPGGKSTQIASAMGNQGLLVSNEINHKRAEILAQNIERIGAKNVIILNEDPSKLAKNFPGFFDKILVDAPCSGEGMFRKDHKAVSYWNKDYPRQCAARQKEILLSAMEMLAPNGTILYSTCTFAPEEDEQVVAWMLNRFPHLRLEPLKKYAGMDPGRPDFASGESALVGAVRMWPHHLRGDGHFIAKLTENKVNACAQIYSKTSSKKKKMKTLRKHELSPEQRELWQKFSEHLTSEFNFNKQDLQCYGNHLYLYRVEWPDISRLRFIRPGFLLGEFKKKRFEPSYTLALALGPHDFTPHLDMDDQQWAQYVHGDVVQISADMQLAKGWALLVCEGKPFAFGKIVGNTVKNFFPKRLRFSV